MARNLSLSLPLSVSKHNDTVQRQRLFPLTVTGSVKGVQDLSNIFDTSRGVRTTAAMGRQQTSVQMNHRFAFTFVSSTVHIDRFRVSSKRLVVSRYIQEINNSTALRQNGCRLTTILLLHPIRCGQRTRNTCKRRPW